jgi:hypothetical protein
LYASLLFPSLVIHTLSFLSESPIQVSHSRPPTCQRSIFKPVIFTGWFVFYPQHGHTIFNLLSGLYATSQELTGRRRAGGVVVYGVDNMPADPAASEFHSLGKYDYLFTALSGKRIQVSL